MEKIKADAQEKGDLGLVAEVRTIVTCVPYVRNIWTLHNFYCVFVLNSL